MSKELESFVGETTPVRPKIEPYLPKLHSSRTIIVSVVENGWTVESLYSNIVASSMDRTTLIASTQAQLLQIIGDWSETQKGPMA